MKATLEFNLPEDSRDFDNAINAPKFSYVIGNLSNELRSYIKYGHKFENADEALQAIQSSLNELMINQNININDCF